MLLFGYNWDTNSFDDEIATGPGQYRLTFTLNDISGELPVYTEYVDDVISAEYPIEYSAITITETVDDELYPDELPGWHRTRFRQHLDRDNVALDAL